MDPRKDTKTCGACAFDRRGFLKFSGTGLAAALAARGMTQPAQAAETQVAAGETATAYPVVDVAPLASIEPGAAIDFGYPDADSPAMLLRLPEPGQDGIGPNSEIVAFSVLCTHKGCPVGYRAERKMLICPCHWSTFDPAKSGNLVIGQASQALPQIKLQISGGMVQASGVTGLIYGRHTNII